MIRLAKPADIIPVVNLGITALEENAYKNLVIDRERVYNIARECVSSAHHFSWVSEYKKNIVGALLVLVLPNMFHERECAHIVQWYCKESKEGLHLMRRFMVWIKTRPTIKVIQYTGELNEDERLNKYLKKIGFNDGLNLYTRLRG